MPTCRPPASLVSRGPGCVRGRARVDDRTVADLLHPVDHDAVAVRHALVDDAQTLDARPDFDPAKLDLVVGPDDADRVGSLHVDERPLGDGDHVAPGVLAWDAHAPE